jgi:FixJ family two-component response regulator
VSTVIEAINKAEIFRFILKPWQRDEFLNAIRAGVDRSESLSRNKDRLAMALAETEHLQQRVRELERRLPKSEVQR